MVVNIHLSGIDNDTLIMDFILVDKGGYHNSFDRVILRNEDIKI
jgi:hypothetical protein